MILGFGDCFVIVIIVNKILDGDVVAAGNFRDQTLKIPTPAFRDAIPWCGVAGHEPRDCHLRKQGGEIERSTGSKSADKERLEARLDHVDPGQPSLHCAKCNEGDAGQHDGIGHRHRDGPA